MSCSARRRTAAITQAVLMALSGCAGDVDPTVSTAVPSDTPPDAESSPPTSSNAVVGVSMGNLFGASCAVFNSGEVKCWGPNEAGELGAGDKVEHFGAVRVEGVTDAAQVTNGGSFGCALNRSGEVRCWGDGYAGDALKVSDPPKVSDATAIAAGWRHACSLQRDGSVMCWGRNDSGQVGPGAGPIAPKNLAHRGEQPPRPPTFVPGVTAATALAVAPEFSCAGEVKCWGPPCSSFPEKPHRVKGLERVRRFSVKHQSSGCAVRDDDSIMCWGQCGDTIEETDYGPATDVSGSCILRKNGDVACRLASKPLQGVGIRGAKRIWGDRELVCALLTDGKVMCAGNAEYGGLGVGKLSPGPFRVAGT